MSVIPSRTTDPATSHEAAAAVARGAATARREMLKGFYLIGTGNDEQAARAAGVDLTSEYCKRASELRASGYIEATGEKTSEGVESGMKRQVSTITDEGIEAWENDADLDAYDPAAVERARQKRVMKVVEEWLVPLDVTTTGRSTLSKAERWPAQFSRAVRRAWGEIE